MKRKIAGIFVCMLLITTSAVASVSSNKVREVASSEIDAVDIYEDEIENTGDDWVACMEACLAIGGLAGNCLYIIIGCAVFPNPLNPCCLSIPLFCGIDIGLFFGCLSQCLEASNPPSEEEIPSCISPLYMKIVNFLEKNFQRPQFFIGVLCLLSRWDEIKQWLIDHGFPIPNNYSARDLLKDIKEERIVLSKSGDCNCARSS